MKKLMIIVKTPDDGNPLDLNTKRLADDKYATVGFKFEHTDGKSYGDYIRVPMSFVSEDQIFCAVSVMARQAYETEAKLLMDEKEEQE